MFTKQTLLFLTLLTTTHAISSQKHRSHNKHKITKQTHKNNIWIPIKTQNQQNNKEEIHYFNPILKLIEDKLPQGAVLTQHPAKVVKEVEQDKHVLHF